MSRLTAWRLAWGMWAVSVLAAALSLVLARANEPVSSSWSMALISALVFAFSTVGALVASRRPENPIGWLFCSGALLWIVGELALEYGVYALISAPAELPGGEWMVWFGGWSRGMGWLLIVLFLLLLFPTGRLPSPRWRPLMWGAVFLVAFFTLVVWLSPASDDLRLSFASNPLGVELGFVEPMSEAMYLALPLALVACGAAAVARFRASGGEERQQLKWFAYAVAVMVFLFVIGFALALTGVVEPNALLWTAPLFGMPVAVGVAIMRYRLYDLGLLINRTLVYGALTVSLAVTYAGSVVALQGIFRALAGGDSQLAVVFSTLTIAALFSPLRGRIQSFIDRRFYRRKYDAAKTLESFAAKLRDETDLDGLSSETVAVIRETVRPGHVLLWLREPGGGRDS